jgi:hypothetical protein
MSHRSICTVFIVIIFSLFAINSINLNVSTLAQTPTSGTINVDTIWLKGNSPYTLNGNVTISNGATLTIDPGVTVNFNGNSLKIKGTIIAKGHSSNYITFNIPASAAPTLPNYSAITFENDSTNYSSETNTGSIIEYTTINSNWGFPTISIDSVSPKINLNKINAASTSSIAPAIEISGLIANPVISNNIIFGRINAAGGLIFNNTISNPDEYAVVLSGKTTLSGNQLYGSHTGLSISYKIYSSCKVENNLITGNEFGLRLLPDDIQDTLTVEQNTISDNEVGVLFERGTYSNLNLTQNNIFGNSVYNVRTMVNFNVDASWNWWGTTNAVSISQSIYDYSDEFSLGKVNFLPSLNCSNPSAPVYTSNSQPSPIPTNEPSNSTPVNSIITSDTVWTAANSPYMLTGNVLVSNNAVLTIKPGVTINFNGYDMCVSGTLNARGESTNRINLNISKSYLGHSAIEFTSSSKSYDLQLDSGSIIENTIVTSTGTFPPILIDSCSPKIYLTEMNCNGYYSIHYMDGSNYAIEIKGKDASPVIANNTLIGGVLASGGLICNNSITTQRLDRGCSAILLRGNVTVLNNKVFGSSSGIGVENQIVPTTALIKSNLVLNNSIGFFITLPSKSDPDSIVIIKNNIIANNSKGIIFNAIINKSPTAVSGKAEGLCIQYNDIRNSDYNVKTYYDCNIDLSMNSWGTTDQTKIAQTIYDHKNDPELGAIKFTPLLTETITGNTYPVNESSPLVAPEFSSGLIIVLALSAVLLLLLGYKVHSK